MPRPGAMLAGAALEGSFRPRSRCITVTAFNRIASGSLATWSRIAVTLISQLALVPVYLSYWPSETYGVWLALQAFYALSTIFGMAHLTLMENEFIRIGNSDLLALRRTLWSSIPIGLLIAFVQLGIAWALVKTGVFGRLLIPSTVIEKSLEADAAWVALANLACWLIIVAGSSLAVRVLCAVGYYSRYAWMGLPYVILNAAVPVIVLSRGGSLLAVGLSQVATTFIFNFLWLMDAIWIAKRHNLAYAMPDLRLGFQTLYRSIYVLLRLFLEMARQNGFRLVMLPIVGPVRLAEFSTQRTVGNTAFQCMNSVYAPLLPELMRYVRDRKQGHMEGAFSIIWLLLVLILCPMTLLVQATMPVIFPWWTRQAFEFDGVLLCYLSASVLINMVSLPAVAICSGSNLVVLQLKIAAIAAALLFIGLVPLTHVLGIRGAALSLLICEAGASAVYVRECASWLRGRGLDWPSQGFRLCLSAVVLTILAALLVAVWPQALPIVLPAYTGIWAFVGLRLWNATPHEARAYLADRLRGFAPAVRN